MDPGPRCATCGRELSARTTACEHCATQAGAPAPRAPAATAPEVEGYRVLRRLGAGGMGVVYLAEDTTLHRRVALKVMSARFALGEAARARFLREARAMATIEHPNVVRIYSYGGGSDTAHIVMELVEGESLAERLRARGRLPIDEVERLTSQVVSALEAAWHKGIVHRDVKPANVLLDARGDVRVADFGLAKPVASSDELPLTQDGRIVGTPHYLSPEQARGEPADLRSDIYSLGVMLYEMLAGAPPFDGATPVAVVAQHLQSPAPPLQDKRADVPAHLLRLVEQMLEKDPARRPQSYAALRQELEPSAAASLPWTAGSPFRGLSAFDFEHAPIFFGRERAVEEAVNALRAQAAGGRAFLLVLGMSGSGKSSLVRAGIVPRLLQPGVVDGVARWRRAVLRPADTGGDLWSGLAAALLREEALPELAADGSSAPELARLLRESPKGAAPLVKGGLSQVAAEWKRAEGRAEQPETRLCLVIDQMEELFTLEHVQPEQRRDFVDALSALARGGRCFVLATLRSDFYGRCEELPELMALKEGSGQYHLQPPTANEFAQMIRRPALAAGLRFEQDPETHAQLDDVLRDSAEGQVGQLPLLEFALDELYRRRTAEGQLTFQAYRGIGGIEGALTRRAEEVFASLPPAVQAALPEAFAALVRVAVGEGETFNRRYSPLDAFAAGETRALVDAFIAARLFVADRDDQGRAVVSIAHEALLQSWPRLRDWLADNRELLRVRGRVALAAALWAEKGRRGDLLLAEGKPLEDALPLLEVKGIDLTADERDLIAASQSRARQRLRARRFLNVSNVTLVLGAAAVMTIYLWKIVPTFAATAGSLGTLLPLPTRLAIQASNWVARLWPLWLVSAALLYRFRRRIRVPEAVQSGMALAVSLVLFGIMLGLVALLTQAAVYLPWMNSGSMTAQTNRAAYGLLRDDPVDAVYRLRVRHKLFGTRASSAFLLGEAHLALGDDDRAQAFYREATARARIVHEPQQRVQQLGQRRLLFGVELGDPASMNLPEMTLLAELVPKRLATLAAELPRLGMRVLDDPVGARVAALNQGTPAFRAGLRKGDVIQRIDGVSTPHRSALVSELRRRSVGQEVKLDVAREGRSLGFAVRLGRAEEMFSEGCRQGYIEDCASLGSVYERGEGVPEDLARAVLLYRRACDGGELLGCLHLGLLHERGRGVRADPARAAALYEAACNAGDFWGCNNLGVLLTKAADVAKDRGRGVSLFSRACRGGLPEACVNHRLLTDTSYFPEARSVTTLLVEPARPYTR